MKKQQSIKKKQIPFMSTSIRSIYKMKKSNPIIKVSKVAVPRRAQKSIDIQIRNPSHKISAHFPALELSTRFRLSELVPSDNSFDQSVSNSSLFQTFTDFEKPPSPCRSSNSRSSIRHFSFLSSKMTPRLQNYLSTQKEVLDLKEAIKENEEERERKLNTSSNMFDKDEIEAAHIKSLMGNNFVGKKGLKTFYDIYKGSNRVKEYMEGRGLKRLGTASVDYLGSTYRLKLPPRALGVVQRNVTSMQTLPDLKGGFTPRSPRRSFRNEEFAEEKLQSISIGQYSIGDNYALAMSQSIPSMKLETLDLNQNRLSNKGAIPILKNLTKGVRTLNLGDNYLTLPTYQMVANIVAHPQFHLEVLILEKNKGRNEGARLIAKELHYNSSIQYLNLSGNLITDIGAEYIADMLTINVGISTLFLQWNLIKGRGGKSLAECLKTNNSVKILDLSHNNLGLSKANESAKSWKNTFSDNRTLVHLDLSHNNFQILDVEYLKDGLVTNHSLLGIHLVGNEGCVDSLGFVDTIKNNNPGVFSQLSFNISPQLITGTLPNKGFHEMNALSNCWICEGWREVRFEFIPGVTSSNILTEFDNVFVHINSDNYRPDLLIEEILPMRIKSPEFSEDEEEEEEEKPKSRISIRMVPPGIIHYFFSIQEQVIIDTSKPTEILGATAKAKVEITPNLVYIVATSISNVMKNEAVKGIYMDAAYIRNMNCKIRPDPKVPKVLDRVKTPWSLPISIFWGYIPDNDDIRNKCFEHDWNLSKIPRVIKDPEELGKVKAKMRNSFKAIRESYKEFAAVEPCNGVFSIGMNVCTDIFGSQCKIIDERLALKDLDLDFIQTNFTPDKTVNHRNPDRSLTRFNYLELIVRLAIRKYHTKGSKLSYSEAVDHMLDGEFLPTFRELDCHKWRFNTLWTEENDNILKFHKPLLNALFTQFSGAKSVPGQLKFVSLEEFITMVTTSGVIDEDFGVREINGLYNLSMMSQVDEIHSDRHLEMYHLEFHEAICRVAEKLAIPSPYDHSEIPPSKDYLRNQPLWLKIKNFLETLLMGTMKHEFIQQYEKTVMKLKPSKTKGVKDDLRKNSNMKDLNIYDEEKLVNRKKSGIEVAERKVSMKDESDDSVVWA